MILEYILRKGKGGKRTLDVSAMQFATRRVLFCLLSYACDKILLKCELFIKSRELGFFMIQFLTKGEKEAYV